MAEFCLDCFNKCFDKNLTKRDVVLSLFKEYCEGCGEVKRVVYDVRKDSLFPNIFFK